MATATTPDDVDQFEGFEDDGVSMVDVYLSAAADLLLRMPADVITARLDENGDFDEIGADEIKRRNVASPVSFSWHTYLIYADGRVHLTFDTNRPDDMSFIGACKAEDAFMASHMSDPKSVLVSLFDRFPLVAYRADRTPSLPNDSDFETRFAIGEIVLHDMFAGIGRVRGATGLDGLTSVEVYDPRVRTRNIYPSKAYHIHRMSTEDVLDFMETPLPRRAGKNLGETTVKVNGEDVTMTLVKDRNGIVFAVDSLWLKNYVEHDDEETLGFLMSPYTESHRLEMVALPI